MMAAELEVEQHRLHTVLERHVRDHLAELAEVRPSLRWDAYDGAEAIERAWRDGLTPDPLLTVSEWANRHWVLSQRASSSPVQRVVFMKASQTGGRQ